MAKKSTSFFSQNIKLLRQRKKRSQEEAAFALEIKRTSLSGYENGSNDPTLKTLLNFSDYYRIPVDVLLKQDLSAYTEQKLQELERSYGLDLAGKNLRILATTIGHDNEENIEIVPEKAKAGYATGFADPEYIKVLATFRMPFLDRNKKYRTFQISGDSMPPVTEGSYVTGEYLLNWANLKNGEPYVFITKNDGIVFKTAYNKLAERNTFLLCSTNPIYEPYEVPVTEILEIWKFVNYISPVLPEPNLPKDTITSSLYELQREVSELKRKVG